MQAMDALRAAATDSNTPLTRIGPALDKVDTYVSAIISRGSVPKCDTMAAMAAVCGYRLALVPGHDLPESAIVIDPPE